MDLYEIVMTYDAKNDLLEVRDYISDVLSVPDIAKKYISVVKNEISKLSVMPKRNRLIDNEPWKSRGLRRILVKNFFVYYRVDDTDKKYIFLM